MPHFNLRHFLETLGKEKGEDVFLLQIGAMDGKTFDPVHEFITRFKWKGLLVEPVPEHFEKLKATYAGHAGMGFAQVAVGEKDGTITMHRVMSEEVEAGKVPRWGTGLASFYTDRNALGFTEVAPFITQMEVPCLRLPSLLGRHEVAQIDVLQIDAEGHDYQILRQLDFTRFAPLVIHLEIVNLPKGEQAAAKRLLDSQGYLHAKVGYDLLAISPAFFRTYL